MAKFCSNCGTAIGEGDKFCLNCGTPIKQKEPELPICPHCGKQMKLTSKFCPHCGKNPAEAKAVPTVNRTSPTPAVGKPASTVSQPTVTRAAQAVQAAAANLPGLTNSIQASAGRGVISVEIPDISGTVGGAVSGAAQILSPIKTLFGGIGGFFRNIKNTFRDKKALVGALIMVVLWTVFWLWNRSSKANKVSEILSALTFAEGGTRGTLGQIVGGAFGKGMVISAFMSLFGGELGSVFGGIKQAFSRGKSIWLTVAGFGAAVICYQLFAGYAGTYGIAVAVSGAVVSLQALGGNTGFFGSLARSVVSRKINGVRTAAESRVNGLLTGAVLGFTVSAALSRFYIPWWIGGGIMVLGIILSLIFDRKGAKA